jgi:penicillin-binding protein 1A
MHLAICVGIGSIGLGSLGVLALFAETPNVTDASTIVRSFSERHHEIENVRPSARFVDALVATEDKRFYSPLDMGIDPLAIIRVLLSSVDPDGNDGGGSSIDQQLAKMLYTPGKSGHFLIDLEQVILAVKLHFWYSHEEILRMYAAMAYYGSGYYGMETASEGYFGHPSAELTWVQAAMLAGLVNAPTADDPRTHPERATIRRKHVLDRLLATGYLSQDQITQIRDEKLDVIDKRHG